MFLLFMIVLGLAGTWWLIDGLLMIAWAVIEIVRQLLAGDRTKSR